MGHAGPPFEPRRRPQAVKSGDPRSQNADKIVSWSHMDVEDIVLDLDPRVCCSVVCLYVYRFESLWKFMIQHLVGET